MIVYLAKVYRAKRPTHRSFHPSQPASLTAFSLLRIPTKIEVALPIKAIVLIKDSYYIEATYRVDIIRPNSRSLYVTENVGGEYGMPGYGYFWQAV
jgi:hypothetical protein